MTVQRLTRTAPSSTLRNVQRQPTEGDTVSTMLRTMLRTPDGAVAPSRIADAAALVDRLPHCTCGEILTPRGLCLNVGDCPTADRAATRGSLRRGTAASSPAAWTIGGGVD